MAQLNSRYINKVFNAGVVEYNALKLPYYVMSFIEGNDIAKHHHLSFIPLEKRLECILNVCKALQISHACDPKIIHADIKPTNIVMNLRGDPKLCDFSIAQRAYSAGNSKTIDYTEVFSSDYSCPERKSGENLTIASDIYSLGLVLYQIITDLTPPFDINKRLPSRHIATAPGNEKYKRWLPELDAIILKATENAPQNRFSSMNEFSEELHNFLTFQKVNCYQHRFKYDHYKYLLLHPVYATIGIVGTASILSFCTIAIISSSWVIQQSTDSKLMDALSGMYAKAIVENKNLSHITIKNGFDIIEAHSDASPGLIYQHSMALAKMAIKNDNLGHADAIIAYKKAISVAEPKDIALTTALLAKSYLANNQETIAMNIINPLLDSFAENDFANLSEAHAYLEIFESDVKYISAKYDDKRSDLELLKHIENQYGKQLTNEYKSLNYYYQAIELFYQFEGGNVSPSDGVLAEDYEKYFRPSLLQAQTLVNASLSIIDKYQNNANQRTISTENIKARILYELRGY